MTEIDFDNGCPDCGSKEYYSGPEGGMCINVCCANPNCRSAFNWTYGLMTERISNTTFRSAFPDNPTESEHYRP